MLQYHFLVSFLLFGRVVNGVVPIEAQPFNREPVAHHARNELVVHYIPKHITVAFHEVLEHFKVRFRL